MADVASDLPYDIEIERDVLSFAAKKGSFLDEASGLLTEQHFSISQHRWMWSFLSKFWAEHHELPTGAMWRTSLEERWPPAERPQATQVLMNLMRRTPQAPHGSLATIRDFAQVSAVRQHLSLAVDSYDRADVAGVEAAFQKGADAIAAARNSTSVLKPMSARDEERFASLKEHDGVYRFPFFLPGLNEITGGGLRLHKSTLTVAPTNVGKSNIASRYGSAAVEADPECVVLHLTTEDDVEEVGARYDAGWTGHIRDEWFEKLVGGREASMRQRLAKVRQMRDRVFIETIHESVSNVKVMALQLRKQHPDVPMLIIVDTPDDLAPPRGMSSGSRYEQQTAIYIHLSGLLTDKALGAVAMHLSCHIDPAQAKSKNKNPKAESVSDTQKKSQKANFVVHIINGAEVEGQRKRMLTFIVTKNKLGRVKDYRLYVAVDSDICQFTEMEGYAVDDDDPKGSDSKNGEAST